MPIRCSSCAYDPRKIAQTGRSRARLRHELARRQDTGTPVRVALQLLDASIPTCFAAPLDVGGVLAPACPLRASVCRTCRRRVRVTRWAHAPRPPSRARSRPRAAGMSGSGTSRQTGAVRTVVRRMNRTCVRTVGASSDGTDANRCTYGLAVCLGPSKWLDHAGYDLWARAMRIASVRGSVVVVASLSLVGRVLGPVRELLCRDGCYASRAPHPGLRRETPPAHPAHG